MGEATLKIGVRLRHMEPVWEKYLAELRNTAETEVFSDRDALTEQPGVEYLITTRLREQELTLFPDLKAVFLFKTGMDGLPLERLEEKHIPVFPSHANADVIAEHGLALALALLHRVPEFDADLRQNLWFADGTHYYWRSISDLKLGILGYGSIGKCLRKKLLGLSCSVQVLNRSGQYEQGVDYAENLEGLIQWCDLLFIAVPLTEDTRDMLDSELLSQMQGKYIVNVARAEICSQQALFQALEQGVLAGFASDVWYGSPDKSDRTKPAPPAQYPFQELKNVVLSPHAATHEKQAHERYVADAVEHCIKYIKEETK
jgi:phosphoglycerate dehydrogenase-like enzyme